MCCFSKCKLSSAGLHRGQGTGERASAPQGALPVRRGGEEGQSWPCHETVGDPQQRASFVPAGHSERRQAGVKGDSGPWHPHRTSSFHRRSWNSGAPGRGRTEGWAWGEGTIWVWAWRQHDLPRQDLLSCGREGGRMAFGRPGLSS